MRVDHVYLELAMARARRERAEAVYRLLVAPVVGLFRKPPALSAPLRSRLA